MEPSRGVGLYKKFIVVVVAAFGLITFFLPLVRITAPLVGTQKISGWDVIKPEEPRPRRDDLGFSETLKTVREHFVREKRRQAPFSVRQAEALVVTLPLAYLALLGGAVLAALQRARALQATAVVGLLAGLYSWLSLHWLNGGVKAMVAGDDRVPLVGALRRTLAERTEINPETGLYLLVMALAGLLAASFLPSGKKASPAPAEVRREEPASSS